MKIFLFSSVKIAVSAQKKKTGLVGLVETQVFLFNAS